MLTTVLWREGEPQATGYESENTVLPQTASPGANVPGNQCQWLILWSVSSTDPLLMDDLVLDHILEFVDGDTLLTGRLVCQRWKTEITKRNGLWRRRCEGLGADESHKVFPSTTDFFRLFVNLRKELGEMSFRENWQVNDHCDGSRCVIHKELTRRWEHERHEDWVTKIVPSLRKKEHLGKKIVVCTRQGGLVVLDEEKKEVAWRTEQLVTAVFTQFKDSIFTVTSLGNIELYSLDGKYKVTETGGKLRGVKAVRSHATAPFLVVWLGGNTLCLVNEKMQVFPLHLPSPQLPEQQDGQEPAEAEPILGLYFNTRVEHTDGQLIVIIKRKSAQCFVIFTTSGDILHHRFLKCDPLCEMSSSIEPGKGRYRFVCMSEGHIVARSIQFRSSGITVEPLWRKAIPDIECQLISAGKKFLLCSVDTSLQVYRMDDGTLVGEIPVFINGDNLAYVYTAETESHSSIVETVNQVQFIEGRLNKDKSRPVSIHLLNAKWLDGLSSSTTNQDFPVAVIYSREHPWGRCIRWSEGLWGKLLPSKPKSDQASDDIAD
ncbi:hypothetical protein ACOMHN_010571 [Nucella lapillus]